MSQIGQWVKGLFGGNANPKQTAPAFAGTRGTPPTTSTTPRAVDAATVATQADAASGPRRAESVASPQSPSTLGPRTVVTPSESPVDAEAAATPASGMASTTTSGGRSNFLPAVVALAAIALALWMMNQYRDFVAPIFFSLNMMITAYPLFRVLRRFRVPTLIAVLVTGLAVIAFMGLFLFGLYWAVAAMVQKLPDYNAQFTTMYSDIITYLAGLGLSEEMLREQVMSIDPSQIASVASGVLASAGNVGALLVVMITALIFMLMDTPQMQERLDIARSGHGTFIQALGNFAEGIRRYWIVTTVFGLIVAVLDLAVLIGLGVPLALVWAIFSFLTNYIPNIGFVIGLVPPALLALVDSGPRTAIAVVVAYSVLNFVVQSIIQPKFAGNAVGLTPTLSFISLLLWTAVLGPLGALLALPMSLLVKALLIDPDPKTRWVNALISSRPQDAAMPEQAAEPTPG